MIVDAHVHILPDTVRADVAAIVARDRWFAACHAENARLASAESLVESMDAHGIDAAVAFAWPFADAALCAEANDYLAQAQRRFPGRIIGFGVVSPMDPGAAAEVRRCATLGLHGIGELNADAQGFSLRDASFGPVAEALAETGLPLNLHCSEPVGHTYPGKGTATPDVLVTFTERYDSLTIIAAHLGGGLPFYGHMPEVHELCKRLWFDTSAQPFLYASSVYRAIADVVGTERLLFGSDHPLLDLPRYRDALRDAAMSDDEQAAILGGNAARLLQL